MLVILIATKPSFQSSQVKRFQKNTNIRRLKLLLNNISSLLLRKNLSTNFLMAKVISQETFDEVLKENIIEFSMSVEESRKETIQQFTAQSVNLSNLIVNLAINEDSGWFLI